MDFEELRRAGDQPDNPVVVPSLRWGGVGQVEVIYYLADQRALNYIRFDWSEVSHHPGIKTPTVFRVNTSSNQSLILLLPKLERAQAFGRKVFVDFQTDEQGLNPSVITIATL